MRKNAAGRLWYQHLPTGLRTHVRPRTAVIPALSLPAGWKTCVNGDGKTYYFNSNTGVSLWTPPVVGVLPSGWKELRTPDNVPFYVCEALQLTCWERPGEEPKAKTAKSANTSSPADNKAQDATPGESPGKNTGGKSSKTSTATKVAAGVAAVDVAINIARLADAADLTPQGIFSATKAAARLTSHGVKFASKKMKMGKLAKSSKFRRASRILNTASTLSGDGDGDDGDSDNNDEDEDNDCEVDDNVDVYTECDGETTIYGGDPGDGGQYQPCEPTSDPPQTLYVDGQGQLGQPYEQPPDPYLPIGDGTQVSSPLQDSPPYQPDGEAPVIINNVYVTENVVNEEVVNNTNIDITENNVDQNNAFISNPTVIQNNNDYNLTTIDDVNEENVFDYQNFSATSAPGVPDAQYQPPVDYSMLYGSGLPPGEIDNLAPPVLPPESFVPPATGNATLPINNGSVPPLVFNPVLAGPMMVNPPPEQGGVVFAPTYV